MEGRKDRHGSVYLKFHTPISPQCNFLSCLPFSGQNISDGIVQLHQPNVAPVRELLLVQDKGQEMVCHLYFQPFSLKAKPCYCSTASAAIFVRPAHADINIHRHGLKSVLLHRLSDGLQSVTFHAVKDSPDGLGHGCSCNHKQSDPVKHSFKRNRWYSASSLPRSMASSMTPPSSPKYTSSPMHSVPA